MKKYIISKINLLWFTIRGTKGRGGGGTLLKKSQGCQFSVVLFGFG
jgi:hypothetical protein